MRASPAFSRITNAQQPALYGTRQMAPGRWHQADGTRQMAPGRWHQADGTRQMAPGRWHQADGTRQMAPGRWHQADGTRQMAPGRWHQADGTRQMAPGRWHQADGTRQMAPGRIVTHPLRRWTDGNFLSMNEPRYMAPIVSLDHCRTAAVDTGPPYEALAGHAGALGRTVPGLGLCR